MEVKDKCALVYFLKIAPFQGFFSLLVEQRGWVWRGIISALLGGPVLFRERGWLIEIQALAGQFSGWPPDWGVCRRLYSASDTPE